MRLASASRELLPDEDLDLVLAGLAPGAPVGLRYSFQDDEGVLWASRLSLCADARGRLDLRADPQAGGADSGSRLLWAIRPDVPDLADYLAGTRGRAGRPFFDHFGAVDATLEVSAGGAPPQILPIRRHRIGPGARVEEIASGQVAGRLYRPAGRPRGAVVAVPGSSGGVEQSFGPALAANGYLVVAPALFAWPGRPDHHDRIALETLSDAVDLACREAGSAHAAVLGSSRGSEAVLLAGIQFPDRIGAVVAVSPGSVVTPGWAPDVGDTVPPWTIGGHALPFAIDGFAELERNGEWHEDPVTGNPVLGFTGFYRRTFTDAQALRAAAIPAERLQCPLLLVAGDADRLWAADTAALELERRAQTGSHGTRVNRLLLPGAGHFIAPRNTPTLLSTSVFHPVERKGYAIGGTPHANAAGNAEAWSAILGLASQAAI